MGAAVSGRDDLLRILVDRPDWMERAACRGRSLTDVFFPDRPGPSPRHALSICEGCVVVSECLGYSVLKGERSGVWGGMTPSQRRRVRRAVVESINEGSYQT